MTGPSEAQVAMGQLALMRAERLANEMATAPPPTFTPSVADLVTLPPSPEQRMNQWWERTFPQQAAADRQAALDLLQRAAGAPATAPQTTPVGSTSWPGYTWRQPAPSPQRMSLASVPTTVEGGGGAWWRKGQGRPAPDPVADRLRGRASDRLGGVIQDAWKASVTAAGYYEWVRMAKYPWWWGNITGGLVQVEQMLAHDLEVFQNSWLPPVTKAIAKENISRAMNWVRESRAAAAARTGGPPVAH